MSDVKVIEATIEQVREVVERGVALDRLRANRDFKLIIQSGYIEKEAIRLVQAKANPDLQTPEMQASIDNQINAIGTLSQYFLLTTLLSRQAAADLEQHMGELAHLEENPETEDKEGNE